MRVTIGEAHPCVHSGASEVPPQISDCVTPVPGTRCDRCAGKDRVMNPGVRLLLSGVLDDDYDFAIHSLCVKGNDEIQRTVGCD